jgi:hypothetical protein
LLRILTNRERPVQVVIAGKAHPQDNEGQEMIRQWIQFIRNTPARRHVVFLQQNGKLPSADGEFPLDPGMLSKPEKHLILAQFNNSPWTRLR